MGRKRDTVRQRDDVNRRRCDTEEGKEGDDVSWANVNQLGRKMKKIHTVDSTGTNGR
jgi:hypothetical protein